MTFGKLRTLVRREMKDWLQKGWPYRLALQNATWWVRTGGYGTPEKPQWRRPKHFPKEVQP